MASDTEAKVLYVENDSAERHALARLVESRRLPFAVKTAETLTAARKLLAAEGFDVIVAGDRLPDGSGTELIGASGQTPVILIGATPGEPWALRASQPEAEDYLPQDPQHRHLEALRVAIPRAIGRRCTRATVRQLQEKDKELEKIERMLEEKLIELQTARDCLEVFEARRKEMEDQRCRYEALFDFAPDGYLVTDLNSHVEEVNLAMCRLLGERRPLLVGIPLLRFIAPQDQRRLGEVLSRFRRALPPDCRPIEVLIAPAHKPAVPCALTLNPVVDAAGAVVGLRWLVRDISERKRADEAVRESNERFRQIAASINHVFWVAEPDPEGVIYVSPAFERIWGHRAEEVYANPRLWVERIHPEDQPEVKRAFDAWLESRGAAEFDVEYRLVQPDGSVRWISDRGSIVLGPGGKMQRLTGVAEDITKRKLAEQELQQARKELEQANADLESKVRERTATLQETVAELEHFSYTITHDMRAPLRAMQGFGRILLEDCAECMHADRRDFLRRIADAAERMDKLITDVLQYSGVIRRHFDLEAVDVDSLLRGILESYPQYQSPEACIRILSPLPGALGNRGAIVQCFSNLLGNAVKFVRPGTTPEISIWAEAHGEFVRYWIQDRGIGIPGEYQEKIWDMFQKLNGAYEGTGIGLALVKKVVGRMGGNVGVESEPGQGSRFWVEFKAANHSIQTAASLQST